MSGCDGLDGAPAVRVLAGAERHGTIDRSLRLLGLGERALEEIPATAQGAMDATQLAQALAVGRGPPDDRLRAGGNVNSGACDDLRAVTAAARGAGAWVHVDGAFGLWAAASPRTRALVDGLELADSWACDGHKWLNVPYDSGYAFCAHPEVHATAMAYTASYLTGQVEGERSAAATSSRSRRAGRAGSRPGPRSGRSAAQASPSSSTDAARSRAAWPRGSARSTGSSVANEVVLNQVLVRVGDAELTNAVERWLQDEGTCWLGATTWRGERLLRISVSNWSTTEADIDLTVDAIARVVDELRAG